MSERFSAPDAAAIGAVLHERLGEGFSLLLVNAVGAGARNAAITWFAEAVQSRADLWQVDLRSISEDTPLEDLCAATGDAPDHPWVLCIEGLEERARQGTAAALLANLAASWEAVEAALPATWVLFVGPESLPLLEDVAPDVLTRVDRVCTAQWTPPAIHTAPGLMSEATPLAVALRPGAEGWCTHIDGALEDVVALAQDAELEEALAGLETLRSEADLDVALSGAVDLLQAELELELDAHTAAATRLESLVASLGGLPDPTEHQRLHHAVALFDLAVAYRILGDARTDGALETAAQTWRDLDPKNREMAGLMKRERGMRHASRGELRAALECLEEASKDLKKARKRLDLDALVALVHVAVALDDRKTALAAIKEGFKKLNKEPHRRQDRVAPLLLLSRGVILLREGDERGASKALLGCVDSADALGPSAELVRLRALTLLPALLTKEGRGEEALDQFEEVFSVVEQANAPELLVEALLEGSATAMDVGDLAVAGAWAREGLGIALDHAGDRPELIAAHAHRATGVVHLALGEPDEARFHLEHATRLYDALVSTASPLAKSTQRLLARC